MSNFYNEVELKNLGLKSYGENVLISKKCSLYGAENIEIGSNVRIDDFCILSGNIQIGNYVHISAFSALYGKFGIEISDYCGISPRSTLFSATDDFSGEYMISPMVPKECTNIIGGRIVLNKFSQIGANSIIMPGIEFEEGAVCGAFSFVNKNLEKWTINTGIPIKKIKNRSKNLLKFEGRINV